MKCKNCSKRALIKKVKRGIKRRYQCKSSGKYQIDFYTYKLYKASDDSLIKFDNAEGIGIRSMTRIMGYSRNTLI